MQNRRGKYTTKQKRSDAESRLAVNVDLSVDISTRSANVFFESRIGVLREKRKCARHELALEFCKLPFISRRTSTPAGAADFFSPFFFSCPFIRGPVSPVTALASLTLATPS
jgi:hypothetical protein